MPLGILFNSACIILGSIIGSIFGKYFSKRITDMLPNIFGLSALCMGIVLIININSLAAVVLALILGSIIGEMLGLENALTKFLKNVVFKKKVQSDSDDSSQISLFISMIVLFSFSGTGVFGALYTGFTGVHTILYAKSILDFFTAIIFATTLGMKLSLTAITQAGLGLILFYSSTFLLPLLSDSMISDFRACGGIITLAVGLKMLNIKYFNIINMLPSLILVMPLSALWSILPF